MDAAISATQMACREGQLDLERAAGILHLSDAPLSAAVPEPSTLIAMILAAIDSCLRQRHAG